MSYRVLIAGCGYVGTALGQQLCADGHQVWGLRRTEGMLPHPIQSITADLRRSEDLKQLPEALTHICYAASADRSGDAEYYEAYVLGLRHLLERPEVRNPGFQQFQFVSSTAVYEQGDGEWVNERSEATPKGFSGKRILEAERLLASSGVPYCILRCAGIYGPGRDRVVRTARAGNASYPSGADRYMNRIHRDDVAGALLHLMRLPALNRVLLGVDEDPASQREVYEWLCQKLGVAPPIAAPADAGSGRPRAGSNKRCDGRELIATGYQLAYRSFREGYLPLLSK